MKLTLSEPKFFKDSIAIISDLVSEARFSVTKDGITLVAMDPANVAMVVFKLLPSLFEEYSVEEPVELALNLNNLKQILRRAGASDVITMEMSDSAKLKLVVSGKSIRTFSLPIIALNEREQKTPNLTFTTTITMPVETFSEAVEDAAIVADSLLVSANAQKFLISASGDLNNANIEIPASENNVDIVSESEDLVKSRYSIEYLKKMVGGAKLSDTVKLQLSKNYPLKLEYVATDKVQLSFVLAPRVEHD